MGRSASEPDVTFVSPHVSAIYNYWRAQKGTHEAPGRGDIDPMDMPRGSLPYVLLVDLLHEPFRVKYRLFGTHCVEIYGNDYTGLFLDQLDIPETVRQQIEQDYAEVARTRRPVVSIYNWQRMSGDEAIAEYAIMPIISGGIVTQCLCAEHISYKGAVFPIEELYAKRGGLIG